MIILVLTLLIFTSTVEILDLSLPVEYKYSSSLQLYSLLHWQPGLSFSVPCHVGMTTVLHILEKWVGFPHSHTRASLCWKSAFFMWPILSTFLTCVGVHVNSYQEVLCENKHYHICEGLGISCSVLWQNRCPLLVYICAVNFSSISAACVSLDSKMQAFVKGFSSVNSPSQRANHHRRLERQCCILIDWCGLLVDVVEFAVGSEFA